MVLEAQSYNFSNDCEEHLKLPYVSDGHDYSIELKKEDKGEFKTTFYGGSTYRIISCSNLPQGKVIFTLYDTDKNLLFSNQDYNYTNYWDFQFNSTIDCIIEVKFISEIADNAQILLLIGFKNQ
ncbi:hypothetical protein ACFLTE_10510 [Bacteroidota bacterium]